MRHALAGGFLLTLLISWPVMAGDSPKADDLAAYRTIRASADRDADSQIQLALWCERHGLNAQRLQHLALAVMADPRNATARGLMGMVLDRDGDWVKSDQVAENLQKDAELAAALAEYNGKRAKLHDSDPDEHWRLALWCEEHGLEAEAKAHLTSVVRLDSGRVAAWKRLGYKRVGKRWVTDEQLEREKADRQAQRHANALWKSRLESWSRQLRDPETRVAAEAALATVTDPQAVPAIWEVFVASRRPDHVRAAQLLAQIDAVPASRALATIAIASDSSEANRHAAEALRNRDPREFADLLISQLRDPIRFEVRPVGGPGSPGVLFVEGQRANFRRFYAPPAVPRFATGINGRIEYDLAGMPYIHYYGPEVSQSSNNVVARYSPQEYDQLHLLDSPSSKDLIAKAQNDLSERGIHPRWYSLSVTKIEHVDRTVRGEATVPIGEMIMEARKSAAVAESQLEGDVAALDRANAAIHDRNDRIALILGEVTGESKGTDRDAWTAWLYDQFGYQYRKADPVPKPIINQNVPLAYLPKKQLIASGERVLSETRSQSFAGNVVSLRPRVSDCFAAGTLVRTRDGLQPIESIRVSDLVLSQDARTGALGYQPVLATHHGPATSTLAIRIGDETLVATGIHRFWRAGQGWTMARDLRTGDMIRTTQGIRPVESIEEGESQPVYNLDVAGYRSFFVGGQGILVHDSAVPDLRVEPFDQPESLAKADTGTP